MNFCGKCTECCTTTLTATIGGVEYGTGSVWASSMPTTANSITTTAADHAWLASRGNSDKGF